MTAQEIRDLFKRYNLPLSRDDVWEVRPGSPVVKHAPLERLAAVIGVEWGPPQILRAEREEAVLIATGKIGDGQPEWSIGEANIGVNYTVSGKQKPYVYAMAEKRAKDRVILKLAGLHGAYSEEESEGFQKEAEEPREAKKTSREIYVGNSLAKIAEFRERQAYGECLAYLKRERQMVWPQYSIDPHDRDGQAIVAAFKTIIEEEVANGQDKS